MGVVLATFVQLHDVSERGHESIAPAAFSVVLAQGASGVVLVFNNYRKVWELPGGLVDPGESPRAAAARELWEESGCQAGPLEWLGLVEVHDGRTHFGAVYRCAVAEVPANYQSEETSGLAMWTREQVPQPLGHTDAALLNRFGAAGNMPP